MVLAFRIYGDFQWPPSPSPPKATELGKRQKGVVEIHYREKTEGDGKFWPVLRWMPGERLPPFGDCPDCTGSIFGLTPDAAVLLFEGNADKDFAVWIDEGSEKKPKNDDWLSFRGAFLLDQFEAKDRQSEPELQLRWPLVRSCEYIEGKRAFSTLAVGRREGGCNFRLNLHLPLPVRRKTLLAPKERAISAFPFCAVYEPQDGAFDKILRFTTLVGGWIESDAVVLAPSTHPPTSFTFKDGDVPSNARLGSFGFSARGEPGQGGFAIYNGNIYDDKTQVIVSNFWPDNSRPFTEDLLRRYGFSIDAKSAIWPALAKGESTGDLSLRFSSAMKGAKSLVSCFVYRIAVSAGGSDPVVLDDIKKDANKLSLQLKTETGGWVKTSDKLYADCSLTWDIGDDDIWSEEDSRWSPKVKLSLHWKDDIPKKPFFGGPPAEGADLDLGLLRHAAYSFAETRKALEPVEAGQPRSMLPDLQSTQTQTVRFSLLGTSLSGRFVNDAVEGKQPSSGMLHWGRPLGLDGKEIPFVRPRMRLTLVNPDDLIPNSDDFAGLAQGNELQLVASNQSFFSGAPPQISLTLGHDTSWADIDADEIADGEPYFASYVTTAKDPIGWSGCLSSLKFDWLAPDKGSAPYKSEELKQTYLRIGGPGTRDGMNKGLPPIDIKDGRVAASLQLVLAVSDVKPVGVDVSRMDRSGRAAPLLIQDDAAGGASGYRYWLKVSESVAPRQDRLIEASIYESAPDAGEQSYVVLSDEPFSIFRYTHRPLSDRGDLGSASVAYYSGDERIWQYRKVSDYYHYVLPPQAVGESADKPRRLEIHDLVKAVDADDAQRPYVKEAGDDGSKDPLKRRAVEFRLTPSTEFWIRPSDVERGYFMPESTSYEIFRQRGEYGLGAALAFLRGEFLYGLPVGIDVSKEETISRQARVAEIEALTGRITGPAQNVGADDDLSVRWNALSRAVARRPERLEVWARDPDSSIDFTPARFANGVTYALRHSALHRPPLDKAEQTGDYGPWPKVGLLAYDNTEDADTKPRSYKQGLSGGALWPVESTNLFRTLLDRPESSGGTIESIALSPTGGDATQKAAFLGGLVTVISDTRNGHVERQKVEVLGRIGALWHRAKHVVVYERTVNPSAQFAPKFEEDENRTRSRRPILRKVREYIELIEPERSYPDFPATAARSAGFLERVRFNSKIINVDSAWSSEIGDYGWKIPLWNLLSARERPQVYPMPDVAFVTAAEGEGDNPAVSQECIDTDNLFFFSDFKAGTSDTNVWAIRLDIDYANMPIAKAIADKVDRKKTGDTTDDHRRPAVTRILPGVRRFTWRLAPAAQKTAINAGRVGKPVFVGLDSVTFMRATHAGDGSRKLGLGLGDLLENSEILRGIGSEADKINALNYWSSAGTGAGTPEKLEYSTTVAGLITALESKDQHAVTGALTELNQKWATNNLAAQLQQTLVNAASDVAPQLAKLKQLNADFDKGPKLCEKLKADAAGLIIRKEMLICTALSDWIANIDKNFPKLEDGQSTPITNKSGAIEELSRLVTIHLRPLFSEASNDVGNAAEGAEKAKAILLAVETEVEAVFDRAQRRVEQFSAGYDHEKPWSVERRKNFSTGLQACVSNVVDDVAGSIDEARQRFAVELSGVAQSIGGHLAKALALIATAEVDALGNLGTVQGILKQVLVPLLHALDTLLPQAGAGNLDEALAKISEFRTNINAEAGISDTLRAGAKNTLQALEDAILQAKSLVVDARTLVTTIETISDETLDRLSQEISSLAASASSIVLTLQGKANGLAELYAAFEKEGFEAVVAGLDTFWTDLGERTEELARWVDNKLLKIGEPVDFLVASSLEQLGTVGDELIAGVRSAHIGIDLMLVDVQNMLNAVKDALGPDQLLEGVVRKQVIKPAIAILLGPINEDLSGVADALHAIHVGLAELSTTASTFIRGITAASLGALEQVTAACTMVFEGANEARDYITRVAGDFQDYLTEKLDPIRAQYQPLVDSIQNALGDLEAQAESLIASVRAFDHSVRNLQNDLSRSIETARMYGDRVLDAVSRIDDGGIMAAPSNILKLYSAVSSAPEIAALKADIDRIRSGFDELSDIIETTEAGALFNKLGDELKALGLTLPFDKISDRLLPIDLSNFDIGKIFGNFGGLKLANLFKGYKIPEGLRDAVRVTHDFDKAQARAWVQIDINAPMPGRRSLFSLGVFQADFIDIQLTAQVRLEVSKDHDRITQTGFGRIGTNIDVVVAGQSMVRFDKFGLNFTREKGLDIEFDPKNIHLNPSFKFIQDFLSTLFPDEVGGLKIIKQDNIPVGVEHDFVIPPMTLNFGTSGVSNISIENHFKLVAFPDFMIANRFNLSTVERPFIFSIFIIGGTGFIQIDAEYRPFDSQLMVAIEAAVGGSAALAFAVGPFVGQVFITLSGVLTYRKMIGKPGGGLSVAVVLVIAGQVEVCGIVTVGITLMLRLNYRDSGQIDGEGSLAVTIRISRFFTISAHANVNYKLRGGKSETSVSASASGTVTDDRLNRAKQAVEQLQNASN